MYIAMPVIPWSPLLDLINSFRFVESDLSYWANKTHNLGAKCNVSTMRDLRNPRKIYYPVKNLLNLEWSNQGNATSSMCMFLVAFLILRNPLLKSCEGYTFFPGFRLATKNLTWNNSCIVIVLGCADMCTQDMDMTRSRCVGTMKPKNLGYGYIWK